MLRVPHKVVFRKWGNPRSAKVALEAGKGKGKLFPVHNALGLLRGPADLGHVEAGLLLLSEVGRTEIFTPEQVQCLCAREGEGTRRCAASGR